MINTQGECILNNYEEFYVIAKKDKGYVSLVMDRGKNRLAVKKYCKGNKAEVYQKLRYINSDFIPCIYHIIEDDGGFVVIEEYIEGQTLQEIIDTSPKLNKETVFHLLEQLCSVIKILHNLDKPIIHRDIKPSNIIITKEGYLKLIDFDAAREYKTDTNKDTVCLGTIEYAPPEQFGFSQTDTRSDIFSIGRVISELIKAQGGSKEAYLCRLQEIANKCTMFDPAQRYQNIEELESSIKKAKKGGKHEGVSKYFLMNRIPFVFIIFLIILSALYINDKANMSDYYTNIPDTDIPDKEKELSGTNTRRESGLQSYVTDSEKDSEKIISVEEDDGILLADDDRKKTDRYNETDEASYDDDMRDDIFNEIGENETAGLDETVPVQAGKDNKPVQYNEKNLSQDNQAETISVKKSNANDNNLIKEDNKTVKEKSKENSLTGSDSHEAGKEAEKTGGAEPKENEEEIKNIIEIPSAFQTSNETGNENTLKESREENSHVKTDDNWYEQKEDEAKAPLINGYRQPVFYTSVNAFYLSDPKDVVIRVVWNDAKEITWIQEENNNTPPMTSEDYNIDNDNLVIKKEFFQTLSAGRYQWCANFDTCFGNMITVNIFD